MPRPPILPPHGGYRRLFSYQKAEIVYDGTLHFCDRFVDKRSRTRDQMIQAARSGKQNIAEGSVASGTSKETELKLTHVARASLEELVVDYEDFLRVSRLPVWGADHPGTLRLRQLNRLPDANYATFKPSIEHVQPEIAANVLRGLTRVTCYLLDRQLHQLEQDFLTHGGIRERMSKARRETFGRSRRGP